MTDAQAIWLAERRTGVGASDVAAIVNESPWGSPWTVWADKTGLTPLQTTETPIMRLGKRLEPVIRDYFEEQTALEVRSEQALVRRGEFALATLDGYVCDPDYADRQLGVFEAKYTTRRTYDEPPRAHILQVQWQLYVTGLPLAYIATLFANGDFRVFEVERDDELIDQLVAECSRFWSLVEAHTPPPTDSSNSTANVLDTLFPADKATDDSVDLEAFSHVLDTWRAMTREQRTVSETIEDCRNEIKLALGDHETGTIAGETVVTWKPTTRTIVDINKLRADHGDAYDKPLTFRTMRLVNNREGDTDNER